MVVGARGLDDEAPEVVLDAAGQPSQERRHGRVPAAFRQHLVEPGHARVRLGHGHLERDLQVGSRDLAALALEHRIAGVQRQQLGGVRHAAGEGGDRVLGRDGERHAGVLRAPFEQRPDLGVLEQRQRHADDVALDRRVAPEQLLKILRHPDDDEEDRRRAVRE